jgi:solute carrier family 35 (UDP-sugar transporter), member A1/2/3
MAISFSDLFSIKYIALLLLVLQNTFLIVLMRFSRHRSSSSSSSTTPPLYAASTAVFMMEIVKFVTCHGVVLYENGQLSSYWKQLKEELTVIEIFRVSIPSLLYTIQNNLLYFALTHLDAATYQVCYQVSTPHLTLHLLPSPVLPDRIA